MTNFAVIKSKMACGRLKKKILIISYYFRKKFPADFLFIRQIWKAMSVNDLLNFWEKIILKWLSSSHFYFK